MDDKSQDETGQQASSAVADVADAAPETALGEDPAEIARRNSELLERHRRKHKGLLPEAWRVQLPVFEGPLDLLLHLIRIDEVEISDIPVALICDQYQAYLDLMDELDLDIAGEYIYEAALLIQLKARMLLPQPKVEEGEEPQGDPREELVQRLLEYRRLKEAAQTLAEVESVRRGVMTRPPERIGADPDGEEVDLGDLSLFDLLTVFRDVLRRYDREHPPPLIFRGESFSIRGQVDRLLKRLDPELSGRSRRRSSGSQLPRGGDRLLPGHPRDGSAPADSHPSVGGRWHPHVPHRARGVLRGAGGESVNDRGPAQRTVPETSVSEGRVGESP